MIGINLLYLLTVEGQQVADTIIFLKQVLVNEVSRASDIGLQKNQWSSGDLHQLGATDLGSFLATEAGLYIKNYGPGSVSTPSLRGGSAAHTLLLWNGLPISSPMLGLVDFSQIDLHAFERVSVTRGGSSALWGSGAVSGFISLNNEVETEQEKSVAAHLNLGSFNAYQGNLNLGFKYRQFKSNTKIAGATSKNDFPYFDLRRKIRVPQANADFDKYYLLQQFDWQVSGKDKLKIYYWFQESHRSIPPTLTQLSSDANQSDNFHRSMLHWQHTAARSVWSMRSGFFWENQDYHDAAIHLAANNRFSNLLLDLEVTHRWNRNFSSVVGATFNHTSARSENYDGSIHEDRLAALVSLQYQRELWTVQPTIRQEIIDGSYSPWLPKIGVVFNASKGTEIILNVSRNYRLPTLNDRYWKPGGNPDLLPENGWNQELSVQTHVGDHEPKFQIRSTVFNRVIQQWILWHPHPDHAFWTPDNIGKVWSRGWETRWSSHFAFKMFSVFTSLNYQFVRSTNEVSIQMPKIIKGTQLIYTPVHQAGIELGINYRDLKVTYRHNYTGMTQGIAEKVSAFDLGSIRINCAPHRSEGLSFHFLLNNVWNQEYVIIERRPMPGINWQLGIRFQPKKSKNS